MFTKYKGLNSQQLIISPVKSKLGVETQDHLVTSPVPQCPSAQLYSGEPIYCHIAMFNLILCFILRVEDAEGCFILTDRYADDREAAVSWNEDHEWSITVLLFLSNLLAS